MARPAEVMRRPPRARLLRFLPLLLPLIGGCLPPTTPGVRVWAVDERTTLTLDAAPQDETSIFSVARNELRLDAAVNETVAFQLALQAASPTARPLDVEFTALRGPAGTLSPANFERFRVRNVTLSSFPSWYPAHAQRPATAMQIPDVLVPWNAPQGGGPITLSGTSPDVIWVDVRIPPTTNPGEYTGELLIRPVDPGAPPGRESAPAARVTLRLNVLSVALPSRRTLPAICRVDPTNLLAAQLLRPSEPAERLRLRRDVPRDQPAVAVLDATMRLFQTHRACPVLWAGFPPYRIDPVQGIQIIWDDYDALVTPWLSGEAFDDLMPLSHWPVPVSMTYPNAELEGGIATAQYARLLAAYLHACQQHFAEKPWQPLLFLRPAAPAPLDETAIRRLIRLGGILRQSETSFPLVAHLPARSLRGLGWWNAPAIELTDVGVWAPPGRWYEPAALARQQALGRGAWLIPDFPPYSPTLSPLGLPADPPALAWQAYRYGTEALWIEDAADVPPPGAGQAAASHGLIYSGSPYGLRDQPVPSIRLKRLRRGLQDHALLTLLTQRGKPLLASRFAEWMVPWAGTDAAGLHLLDTKPTGWPRDERSFALARDLVLQELASTLPEARTEAGQLARLTEWSLLIAQTKRVHAAVEGVRLRQAGGVLEAAVIAGVTNASRQRLTGQWELLSPPLGWTAPPSAPISVEAGAQRRDELPLRLESFTYNTEGAYAFALRLRTDGLGEFTIPARLAVAACPFVQPAPVIDGVLDWPLASNNTAADFRLVRGAGADSRLGEDRPAGATQAFFAHDETHLYVGVRCRMPEGQTPQWLARNEISVEGAVPWGEDLVEVLIDPRPRLEGTAADLYCLQIKPNGVVVSRRGCLMDPPINPVQPWSSGVRVAVQREPAAWVVELALPLTALGADVRDNAIWGLNVTRLDAARGEYSSWSGAKGMCYAPARLGNLVLLPDSR